jgi:tetratricopeptide (TPR) repeat protein
MVGRGIILGLWGRYPWSTEVFQKALERLPGSEIRGRASALIGICQNLVEQGDAHRAIPYAINAEELPVGPLDAGKIAWNSGAIFATVGRYSEALLKLEKAQESIRDIAPVDAALVTIDKCEVLLRAGRPTEANREAEAMLEFIEPLRARTPLAEAAAIELAAAGARGEGLTFAVLSAARTKVKTRPRPL